jgi:phosphoribosylamine---glycine ligase
VDELEKNGIPAIGPHKEAARLEASKTFSKKFMEKYGIPTAEAREFSDAGAFEKYMREISHRVVIKKSGLAAGKGVLESTDKEELIRFGKEVLENDSLLVEEFLSGYEVSIFALTDGKDHFILPTCADFKKAGEGDTGPNTGGMGAVCPVPLINSAAMKVINETIISPTFRGMESDGLNYKGVLYFGLMITEKGPRLLEYNVRLGDPEAQVLLPLILSDFGNLTEALIEGKLGDLPIRLSDQSALGVVVAAEGYPGDYKTDHPVKPIPIFPENDALVFHGSTKLGENQQVLTGGGRCFTVVGMGQNILNADVRAYEAVAKVNFPGSWYRNDIGKKFFAD